MLHTITTANHSLINPQLISAQDAVLFWQDGVIISLQNNSLLNVILEKTTNCYILDSDIIARGLEPFIDPRLKIINMQQVVELTTQYFPQMNWD
ncbi:sulfurtransferase complex subunit TusB [uncultured Gilliamella sp.]|jgi:sulfur relay protein TusB/DsrH|uniref:sulfurtransferase complex subunit TusB n=1 Tax=uncultured Gilliamella sp. TaxID=1193505 RepID=UPI0025F0AA3B|nr:sulfurtransferase complex subunit TusB [uncultured Gilliamella sp.]